MPQTDEEKKISRAISNKKYKAKNREKINERQRIYNKKFRQTHAEKVKFDSKIYYQKNKEMINEKSRIYRETHREEIREKQKKHYQEHKDEPYMKKQMTLYNWKRIGLKGNYEKIYEYYLKITHCQECEFELGVKGDGTGRMKCMDHHHPTGLFRNILCHTCNVQRK